MKKKRFRKHLTTAQIIILGFAGLVLCGALLLMLPIASQSRTVTPFHEALLTATSASCVTGLVVRSTGAHWSLLGQIVILLLIQIGGLGVVTVALCFVRLSGRKISLFQRSAHGRIPSPRRRLWGHCPRRIGPPGDVPGRGCGGALMLDSVLPPIRRQGDLVRAVPRGVGVLQRGL